MKYLKIENGKGYYLKDLDSSTPTWAEVDQISRDDLFAFLNKAISDDFEMDTYEEDLVANKAHQIIYKSLHEKFVDLLDNKSRFKDESENMYKAALEKYSS
jgi:hypothetical protein